MSIGALPVLIPARMTAYVPTCLSLGQRGLASEDKASQSQLTTLWLTLPPACLQWPNREGLDHT